MAKYAPDIPEIFYFPIAARAELSRLIVAAGGGSLKETFPGAAGWKSKPFAVFGAVPALKDGDLTLVQSGAIEKYLSSIQPTFKGLTPQQRAMDNMFGATKEDLIQTMGKVVFGKTKDLQATSEEVVKKLDGFLTPLNNICPDAGFVNGLGFPTAADLVVLYFAEAELLSAACFKKMTVPYDWATKFPKLRALADRTKEAPGVREYYGQSKTLKQGLVIPKLLCRTCGIKCCCCCGCEKTQLIGPATAAVDGAATAPAQMTMGDGPPELFYFHIAGRGELARLIAAAGNLEIKDTYPVPDYKTKFPQTFGSLPVLQHGSLTLAQSSAVETYFAEIAPKFSSLTPKQRALDDMFGLTKEDMLAGCAKVLFNEDKSNATKDITACLDRYLGPLEKRFVPESGFVHGLDFPTVADLVVLNVCEGTMPFGAAMELAGGYDLAGKFPKFKALSERTKAAPGVKEYMETTVTMKGVF